MYTNTWNAKRETPCKLPITADEAADGIGEQTHNIVRSIPAAPAAAATGVTFIKYVAQQQVAQDRNILLQGQVCCSLVHNPESVFLEAVGCQGFLAG